MASRSGTAGRTAAALGIAALVAAGCGGGGSGGGDGGGKNIRVDGSSTVAPLSEAVAEPFQEKNEVKVTVGTSGTGGGFEKFCAGEVDIADASRPIKDEEAAACKEKGIGYQELHVANDGIAVVVNTRNDWADCLTVDQLSKIWRQGSKVDSWRDVDSDFPKEGLELYGPGTDSGTFDFFTDAVNGEEGNSRTDYNATENDNVIVQGVSGSEGGLGYFGLSYAEQNDSQLKAIKIDGGKGCVAPTTESVQSGEYAPLSRPLYIYVAADLAKRKEGKAFIDFYVQNVQRLAGKALFVPLTDEQQAELEQAASRLTT